MTRPTEFTDQSIIQAGLDLQKANRAITGFALRKIVGGGSASRLKQVWDEHLNSQAAAVVEPVAELPVEVAEVMVTVSKSLTDRIAALAVELNDKAVKAAERKVHEVVRGAGEQRAQAERELADATETVNDLEAKLDEAEINGVTLSSKLDSLQEAYQAQAVELAKMQERLTFSEQAAKTAHEQHAAELVRMSAAADAERARHQEETEKTREELGRVRQSESTVNAECVQLRAELLNIKTESGVLKVELATVQAKAKADASQQSERLAKAEADRNQASSEAGSAREAAAKLSGQVEAMQSQVRSLTEALASRQVEDAKPGTGKK